MSDEGSDKLYVGHSRAMKRSPAWQAAPDHCRRALDRLELEHMNNCLKVNGRLCATYSNFEEAGIPRAAVRLAIMQAVHLGFLEITRRGNGKTKLPNLYRLTYVKGFGANGQKGPEPTDEWKRIETAAHAKAALRSAEDEVIRERAQLRARKEARKASKLEVSGDSSLLRRAN